MIYRYYYIKYNTMLYYIAILELILVSFYPYLSKKRYYTVSISSPPFPHVRGHFLSQLLFLLPLATFPKLPLISAAESSSICCFLTWAELPAPCKSMGVLPLVSRGPERHPCCHSSLSLFLSHINRFSSLPLNYHLLHSRAC